MSWTPTLARVVAAKRRRRIISAGSWEPVNGEMEAWRSFGGRCRRIIVADEVLVPGGNVR